MAKTLSRRSLLWGLAATSAGSVWLAAACGQVAAPTMEPAAKEDAPKAAEEAAKPMEAKTVTGPVHIKRPNGRGAVLGQNGG